MKSKKEIIEYLQARFQEKSTYAALFVVFANFGIETSPETRDAIYSLTLLAIAFALFVLKE